ncbi:MAG: hypothetical protein HYY52_06800 [Candidatus Melainabacteria bacterium]|nr:hypothetical protein [Candidatus Melainabacteria bacterium]
MSNSLRVDVTDRGTQLVPLIRSVIQRQGINVRDPIKEAYEFCASRGIDFSKPVAHKPAPVKEERETPIPWHDFRDPATYFSPMVFDLDLYTPFRDITIKLVKGIADEVRQSNINVESSTPEELLDAIGLAISKKLPKGIESGEPMNLRGFLMMSQIPMEPEELVLGVYQELTGVNVVEYKSVDIKPILPEQLKKT